MEQMSQAEYVKLDMPHMVELAREFPHRADKYADERLCDYAYGAMKEKLAAARAKGRGGWWDADRCSLDFLKGLLAEHVEKGDMVDVMNLAAMIYAREQVEADVCPNCDTALPEKGVKDMADKADISALLQPTPADDYAHLTSGGDFTVPLNQREACVVLKVHDYGVDSLDASEVVVLHHLTAKLKDQIHP